ncbi:MAG TPA: DUF1398 family protein [Candidatus Sulfotelmatobacter sp.]|nr:DUF1398 family protein [Candidatus Sulfotelmatobacter sp.]
MDKHTQEIIQECSAGSVQGRLTFPEVVRKLTAAGIEQYHADLRRTEKTYYMPDGASHVTPSVAVRTVPAAEFAAVGIVAALKSIQAGKTDYRTFCEEIAAAGCVGYLVCIGGRRAVYYGRKGDTYVEPFPAAL